MGRLSSALLLCALLVAIGLADPGNGLKWTTTWGTSHTETGPTAVGSLYYAAFPPKVFNNQTIRMIIRTSIKGEGFVRVRLSNAYPTLANASLANNKFVTIQEVHIAYRDVNASITANSDRVLTFNGDQSVTISPDADVLSDPIVLNMMPQTDIAITMFIAPNAGAIYAARHAYTEQTSYIAGVTGNFADNVDGEPFNVTTTQTFLLSAVEVLSHGATIVAFGDSITEGFSVDASTRDTNTRYTNFLAASLISRGKQFGVVNAGVSGNQLYYDSPSAIALGFPGPIYPFGPNGLARFGRDVLDVVGVKYIISLIGVNDIAFCVQGLNAHPKMVDPNFASIVTTRILLGYDQLIRRAHDKGIMIYGGTLLPYSSSIFGFVEPIRQAVNTWIRTSDAFDAFIDFDLALRDPTNTSILLPAYDSGDHIHPNALGYQVMANAIDLSLF